MTLNNLSTIVPFGVHGYYVIDSICKVISVSEGISRAFLGNCQDPRAPSIMSGPGYSRVV